MSGANLSSTTFAAAELMSADFTGAEVRGTDFSKTSDGDGSGITSQQLYSTASYQVGDLAGIRLKFNNLVEWDFAGMNLNNTNFQVATMTNADLANANLTGTTFEWAILTNADLSGSDITNTSFHLATLTNANFTGTDVRGASFSTTTDYGFTAAQLYSTASYQIGDLTGVSLGFNDLTGWIFTRKKLTNARFTFANLTATDLSGANLIRASFNGAELTNTNLSGANLTYADFQRTATLLNVDLSSSNLAGADFVVGTQTNTDLTGADARAAHDMELSSAITHNFIHPDGHVEGLDIMADEEMRLWDFNLATPVPILVQNALSIDSTGTLRAVFEDDDWGSTLTFDAGIGVSLDGTLELLVDSREGSNVSSMVGVTFDLFDWTGVTPSGTFAQITTADGLVWDTSDLYSTGEVTLLSAPSILFADFDDNGTVDEADLDAWRAAFGSTTDLAADGNGDGVVDAADYTVWRDHSVAASVAVPEPTAFLLTLLGLASCGWYRR